MFGFIWPVTSFMKVDLPAPFGPRRPVMPLSIARETSFRPRTFPYHFERFFASMTALTG